MQTKLFEFEILKNYIKRRFNGCCDFCISKNRQDRDKVGENVGDHVGGNLGRHVFVIRLQLQWDSNLLKGENWTKCNERLPWLCHHSMNSSFCASGSGLYYSVKSSFHASGLVNIQTHCFLVTWCLKWNDQICVFCSVDDDEDRPSSGGGGINSTAYNAKIEKQVRTKFDLDNQWLANDWPRLFLLINHRLVSYWSRLRVINGMDEIALFYSIN